MSAKILPLKYKHNNDWSNWRWQMKHRIKTVEELTAYINLTEKEKENIKKAGDVFPMSVTPYYASLISKENPGCPIRMQCIPSHRELIAGRGDMDDPLHEDADAPVPGLTHRYPDRVLLLVTHECSLYCRHCTRKRKVGDRKRIITGQDIDRGIEYIKSHPEIRDVLLSGGDPLMLSDSYLEQILRKIRAIPHVEIIRIGTRTPVVLPQRITGDLVARLKKYHPVWINTHFNHPREFTSESTAALSKLADAGIPLGNQTVLLRGVNDCHRTMKKLVHLLVKNRVRPYYLYQCDLSRGIEHFRTKVAKGVEIMESLIGHTSGLAVPTYVVDAPGGGGKIPVLPNYQLSMSSSKVILRNYEGVICVYEEPDKYDSACLETCDSCPEDNVKQEPVGLQKLVDPDDDTISLIPEGNRRQERLRVIKGEAHGS